MNRDADKIGEIYHLGKPARRTTKSMLRIIHFLGDGWYTFIYDSVLPKRKVGIELLVDHVDVFKHHVTLLPYTDDNVEDKILQDPRWQLCIQCGLRYDIINPDPAIFEIDWKCGYEKLIILSCSDWRKLCTDVKRELKRLGGR